jgi:hypothetical protein
MGAGSKINVSLTMGIVIVMFPGKAPSKKNTSDQRLNCYLFHTNVRLENRLLSQSNQSFEIFVRKGIETKTK